MKNTIVNFKAEPSRHTNGVTECVNLRPVTMPDGSTALAPAGTPALVTHASGKPLLEYVHADGSRSVFTASGATLNVVRGASAVTVVADCGGAVNCAAPVPEGCVTVMAEGRPPRVLEFDSETAAWTDRGELRSAEIAAPSLTAESMAALSEPLAVDALASPAYQAADTQLSGTHRKRLTAAAAEAYVRLNSRARAAGAWLQPVVARVRIFDASGATLHVTSPVLLGTPAALSATGELAFSDKSSAVTGLALTAQPFRIRLAWPDASGLPEGAKAVVEVSPQLHPLDPEGVAETRLTRLSATSARLELTLPGVRLGTSGAEMAARLVPRALACLRNRPEVAATVAAGATSVLVPTPSVIGVNDERKALAAVTSAPASSAPLTWLTSAPHSFSARRACVNGHCVVWADISPLPLEAPSVRELAAEWSDGDSAGSVQVTRADGTSTVSTFRLDGLTPARLSALIVYPDARAVSIRVAVGRKAVTLPLTPTPDGTMAYHLSADLRPVEFDTELPVAVVPAANPPRLRHRGAVLVATASQPFTPLASASLSGGSVSAVSCAARSNSSWDFGRRHFYLFGSEGIHALAVSADMRSVSVARLSPVDASAGAVAPTPQGVMAVAGGALVCVGGGAVRTVESPCHALGLAFDASRGELWMLRADGSVDIRTDSGTFSRPLAATGLLDASGRVYASTATSSLVAAGEGFDETFPASTAVVWSAVAECGPATPRWLELHLTGSRVKASLSLRGDGGAGADCSRELLGLTLSGRLDSPLRQPVLAPPHRNLTIVIEAGLSADSRLCRTSLSMKNI